MNVAMPALLCAFFLVPFLLVPVAAQDIHIVEVEANPPGTDTGNEWVRLFNVAAQDIDLTDWFIENKHNESYNLSGSIPPCDSIQINFTKQFINNKDETLTLYDAQRNMIDSTSVFSDQRNNDYTWSISNPKCQDQTPPPPPIPGDILSVTFVDLGSAGESILVVAPGGNTMLIDGGLARSYDQVRAVFDDHNIDTIDVMIATHADQDHIQGLTSVIQDDTVSVERVLLSHVNATTKTFEDFVNAIESAQIPTEVVHAGHPINLADLVSIAVISPPEQGIRDSSSLRNTNSLVVHMEYGSVSFLFTGDATAKTEKWITSNMPPLDIDIMNGPHHGSHHSSTPSFIDYVTPQLVVFSADDDNRYGHPHPDVISRYESRGIAHYQTGTNGTITITTDGVGCSLTLPQAVPVPCYSGIDLVGDPAPDPDPTEVRKIGVLISATGDAASIGDSTTRTMHYAVDQFNSYLNDAGRDWTLEVSVHDDGTDPAQALELVRELDGQGIKAVIGPLTSPALGHVAPYVNDNDMLAISYGSSASAIAQQDRIFRLVVNETGLASAYAHMLGQDGVQRVIPVFRDDLWGRTLNDTISERLHSAGILLQDGIAYPTTDTNHTDIITRIGAQLHPETATGVILLTFDEVKEMLDEAAADPRMLHARWYGSNSITEDVIKDDTRATFMDRTGFIAPATTVVTNEITRQIDMNVLDADVFSYTIYDAVFILGKAIDAAGSATDADRLADLIPGIAAAHEGALGNTELNSAGDLNNADYTFNAIRDGMYVPVARYTLAGDTLETLGPYDNQASPHGLVRPISGDWDGDGDHDIGAAGILGSGHQHILLNANGTAYDTVFSGIVGSVLDYMPGTLRPLVGDWDGDGDHDIGAAGILDESGHLHVTLETIGAAKTDAPSWTVADEADYLPGTLRPLVGDWDGDGDHDIGTVGILHNGMIYHILRVDGNVLSTGATPADRFLPGTLRPLVGDWNGDDIDDIGYRGIISSGLQNFVLYTGNEITFDSFVGDYNFYVPGTMRPLVGDWDGDGDHDIGTVGIDSDGLQHFTLVANGTMFDPVLITAIGDEDHYLPGTLRPLVGDWDGDGDDDIAAAGIVSSGLQLFTLTPFNNGAFETVFVGYLGNAADYLTLGQTQYDITISHAMRGQPITPPPVAAHNHHYSLFTVGGTASANLEGLAEDGRVQPVYRSMMSSPDVADVKRGTSVFSGGSTTIRLLTPGDHPYISFASMLDCTNDGFVGMDSALLPVTAGTLTLYPKIYDAGTEVNTESFSDLPAPFLCRPSSGMGQTPTISDITEGGVIHVHPGIVGHADLGATHMWDSLPVRVDITRVS